MSDKKTVLFFFSSGSILGRVAGDLKSESEVITPWIVNSYDDFKHYVADSKAANNLDMIVTEIFPEGLVMKGGIASSMINEMKKQNPSTEIVLWSLYTPDQWNIDAETRKGCVELPTGCLSKVIKQEIHRLLGFDMSKSDAELYRELEKSRSVVSR